MAMAHLINLELAWHEKESTGSKVQKIQSGSYKVYQAFWFIANGQAWGIVNVGGGIICRLLNKKPK